MNINVVMGRFNPPHIGHLATFKVLDQITKADKDARAFIVTSKTQDSKKNPLSFNNKIRYLTYAVAENDLDIDVVDEPVTSIYGLLKSCSLICQTSGGGTVTLYSGSDRVASYKRMTDSIMKELQSKGECLNVNVVIKETLERNTDNFYSATNMRQYVIDGDVDSFIAQSPFKDDEDLALQMFKDVEKGMGITSKLSESQIFHSPNEMKRITVDMAKKVNEHYNDVLNCNDKLYYVGGCVRDAILGKTPNDFDLVTTMSAEDYAEMFNTTDIRWRDKSCIVVPVVEGEEEETCCLSGNVSLKFRLEHSDLTMNAIAEDILTGDIIDPMGGQKDIDRHVINFTDLMKIEIPKGHQPARVLRAIRFASILGWDMTDDTADAIQKFSNATKGKLKVSQLQFANNRNKAVAAGKAKEFDSLLKQFNLTVNFTIV